jgi:aryl sulfotransferase
VSDRLHNGYRRNRVEPGHAADYVHPVPDTPRRYTSSDEDSARWDGFPFRDGDIVISTRSKSGTTWMQMICALLIFQTPELPAPIALLSPWLDHLTAPLDQVLAGLAAQEHRRFIKTHTPLDGVPVDPRVTYIVVARHPLDMAVSLYHQGNNLDRVRMAELIGLPPPDQPPAPRRPPHEWVLDWVRSDDDPVEWTDSLPGVMAHLRDAWRRRAEPNLLLVHYQDLQDDLGGQMRMIAGRLGIEVAESAWPALVDAATFTRMRARASDLVPDRNGVLKDPLAFFRRGESGAGRASVTPEEFDEYLARAAELAPADLLAWLHRDDAAAVAGGRAAAG